MAVYPPPSFQSTIFDTNAFIQTPEDGGLTEAQANLLYYKYPVGQATETLQQTDHTGLATFQASIDLNAGTLKFPDNTVQTTAFTGGGGGESLSATLLIGNSAGATSINMNNNAISNALTVNTLTMNRGSSTVPSSTNINIGANNMTSTASNGGNNIAVGLGCLDFGLTSLSEQNIAFGAYTLQGTSGSYNLGIGSLGFTNLTSGSHNVGIGFQSNQNMTTGSYNVAIGDVAGSNGSGAGNVATSSTAIGRNAKWTGSNQIVLGTASETVYLKGNAQNEGLTTMLNNLSMGSTTAIANRQISSTYYNFYASDNVGTLTYSGRLYGNLNSIVYDCPDTSSLGSSNHIFYCYNGATALASLSISNLSMTSNIIQPASNDSTTKIPTTAWVQGAIVAGAGTNLIPANNTWTGTNAFNNVAPITSTATQPASNDSSTKIPTTAWVQGAITAGLPASVNQVWSWNCFNITSALAGGSVRSAYLVLPYSSAITFSTTCRIECNYSIFSNSSTTQTVIPNLLSAYTGQSGGTNVNPNTFSIVDLVYNPNTQLMNSFICQSTYANVFTNTETKYWRGNTAYNFVPIRFDYVTPLTLNSPSAGLMTVKFMIGYPAINYSSNPNYLGNLCSVATSIRIKSSQATTTDTIGITTYSSGVAYFIP